MARVSLPTGSVLLSFVIDRKSDLTIPFMFLPNPDERCREPGVCFHFIFRGHFFQALSPESISTVDTLRQNYQKCPCIHAALFWVLKRTHNLLLRDLWEGCRKKFVFRIYTPSSLARLEQYHNRELLRKWAALAGGLSRMQCWQQMSVRVDAVWDSCFFFKEKNTAGVTPNGSLEFAKSYLVMLGKAAVAVTTFQPGNMPWS